MTQINGTRERGSVWGWSICFFSGWMFLFSALADPLPLGPNGTATGAAASGAFVTVNHLGEAEQQAATREGQLLSHRRATDPFGNSIRGPYKALPVVEHPVVAAGQPAAVAPVVNEPTIEKAVQELGIGAVNVGAHEILVGSRSIREGDLLVLESGGRQFVVWVESVDLRGVSFCDIGMTKHLLKTFGSGPTDLPTDSVRGVTDIHHFLNQNVSP